MSLCNLRNYSRLRRAASLVMKTSAAHVIHDTMLFPARATSALSLPKRRPHVHPVARMTSPCKFPDTQPAVLFLEDADTSLPRARLLKGAAVMHVSSRHCFAGPARLLLEAVHAHYLDKRVICVFSLRTWLRCTPPILNIRLCAPQMRLPAVHTPDRRLPSATLG